MDMGTASAFTWSVGLMSLMRMRCFEFNGP